MCGTCWRLNATFFIRRYVVSIPFGYTQRKADGFGEKNWIHRGQSKCVSFYKALINNTFITCVQQCILFKGDKRRDIDLEFALNIPNISVTSSFSSLFVMTKVWWIPPSFSVLRGPFLFKKKNLNFVFDFIVYFYKCYHSAMEPWLNASNLHDKYYKSFSPVIVS